MTRIVRVDPRAPSPEQLQDAVRILRRGGLVAFPTETVYGLGAHALDEEAVRGIFAAKGRPAFNPLIVHVTDADAARALSSRWPATAERLAGSFWPGPLTLVLPKRSDVPDVVTAGLPSVALRVPAHPVAAALLAAAAIPLAAPSANRYTELSPTRAEHVARGLGGRVDLILDGGPTEVGIESTVVDLTGDAPLLLRPGSVTREELEEVVGPVAVAADVQGTAPRPGPGMVERHYSPRARLLLFDAHALPRARERVERELAAGRTVGAIVWSPVALEGVEADRLPASPGEYARRLYATLHDLDERGCDLVLVERVPLDPGWDGVRDRLRRAAHPE